MFLLNRIQKIIFSLKWKKEFAQKSSSSDRDPQYYPSPRAPSRSYDDKPLASFIFRGDKMSRVSQWVGILFLLFLVHCAGPSVFQPIPLNATPPVIIQPIYFGIDEINKRGYLINSNNTVLYSDGSLIVFDLTNPIAPSVVRSVSLLNFSGQAYLDTNTKYLYATNRLNQSKNDNNDQILKINIDETSSNFLTYQQFQTGNNPFGIASDGTNLFVVNQQSLDFFLLSNLSSRTEVNFNILVNDNSIPNTVNTRQMAISPSGNYLYVSNEGGPVLILNKSQIPPPNQTEPLTTGTNNSVDYIIAGTNSTIGITSDTQNIYIVEDNPPSLLVFADPQLPPVDGNPQTVQLSNILKTSIPLGNFPNEVAADGMNSRAYVTLAQNNEVSVIDTNNLVELTRIPLTTGLPGGVNRGENPFAISVGHFGGVPYIYVLNLNTNNISIINGDSLSVVGSYP